eukprot:370907-Pyramimonas_sp.AAC.1
MGGGALSSCPAPLPFPPRRRRATPARPAPPPARWAEEGGRGRRRADCRQDGPRDGPARTPANGPWTPEGLAG